MKVSARAALWHRFFLLVSLVVSLVLACVPLQALDPVETLWIYQDSDWKRLKHRRLLNVDAVTESSFVLEHVNPKVCLVGVSEVGVSAEQFFDESRGGVGKTLWRRGFSVLSLSIPRVTLEQGSWRSLALEHLNEVVDVYLERCKGKPIVGIGHGVGGSLLLEPSLNAKLSGVVLLAVPLTYAGTSIATQKLLTSTTDWAWRDLVAYPVPANFSGSTTMEEVVVTNRSSSKVRFEFYRAESMTLPLMHLEWISPRRSLR